MLEKEIEKRLVTEVKRNGGIALKFTSPGFDGMPDRIILMKKGRVSFVEVKAPGKKPRPLQLQRHDMLRKLGFKVYVLDNVNEIARIIGETNGTA